jgi:Glycosyl transferase family 2
MENVWHLPAPARASERPRRFGRLLGSFEPAVELSVAPGSTAPAQLAAAASSEPQADTVAEAVRRSLGPSGPRFVVALVPAHNEEGQIGGAIRSLPDQETPPQFVAVCADNCTDATARVAEAQGAYVLSTSKNENKKAGALSRALETTASRARGRRLRAGEPEPGARCRRTSRFSPKVPKQGRRAVK